MLFSRSVRSAKGLAFVLAAAVCAWIACESAALGQFSGHGGGGGRHGGGGKAADSSKPPDDSAPPPPPQVVLTPHGGQYLATDANRYELVFMPFQTRIYLYDARLKPLSARDVHAQMSLQLPTENSPRRVAFQYVALPAGAAQQDYVAAGIDLLQLQDKETPIALEFSGLSDRSHPTASFTPVFSPARLRPYVAQVLPMEELDRDGAMRQRVCPVSGDVLGNKGPIVKVYIGEYPLYLCCAGCIAAVRQSPDRFLPQSAVPLTGR
jgi:hypothetical protein